MHWILSPPAVPHIFVWYGCGDGGVGVLAAMAIVITAYSIY